MKLPFAGYFRKKEPQIAPESLKNLEARVRSTRKRLKRLEDAQAQYLLDLNLLYEKTTRAVARLAGREAASRKKTEEETTEVPDGSLLALREKAQRVLRSG